MAALVASNLEDVVSEFIGVASSFRLFGVRKFISVPSAAALVWLLIVFGKPPVVKTIPAPCGSLRYSAEAPQPIQDQCTFPVYETHRSCDSTLIHSLLNICVDSFWQVRKVKV